MCAATRLSESCDNMIRVGMQSQTDYDNDYASMTVQYVCVSMDVCVC